MATPAKVHFVEATDAQKKAVRRRTHRYWMVHRTTVDGLMPWIRWSESSKMKLDMGIIRDGAALLIVDVIDDKVVHKNCTLRDLYAINSRRWPLKEKMLEVMADRQKAKALRRTMAAAPKS